MTTNREAALQSRELVTIRADVPLEVDFEALRYRGPTRERCYELFSRLEFRTIVAEYAPTADTIQKDYALVTTLEELDALIAELRAAGEFALRVIPDQWSAMRATIVGMSFSHGARQARYVPVGHESPDDERRPARRGGSRPCRSAARPRSNGSGRCSRTRRCGRSATI